MHRLATSVCCLALFSCSVCLADDRASNTPPDGYVALFDGKTLDGWRGRQADYSPYAEAKLSKDELAAKQTEWNADRDQHWRVDTDKGEIVSDGHGVYLTTNKDYGDFEL